MTGRPMAVQKTSELAWLLKHVRECDPLVIVEIGVDQGGTFCAFEEAAPLADVIGIDIGGGCFASTGAQPFEDPRVIRGDSHDMATRVELERRLAGRPIDFLFIDADHSYDGVKQDWEMYSPLVKGVVAFHDIVYHRHRGNPPSEVDRLWLEIRGDSYMEYIDPSDSGPCEHPHWGGIGVLEVA